MDNAGVKPQTEEGEVIVPIGFIILIFAIFPIPNGVECVFIPIMGLVSVLSAKIMYKQGFIKSFDEKKGKGAR